MFAGVMSSPFLLERVREGVTGEDSETARGVWYLILARRNRARPTGTGGKDRTGEDRTGKNRKKVRDDA